MADITTSSLDGILKGNTSSRPASSNNGDLYINTETGFIEIYSSTYGWEAVGAAPSTVTSVSATDVPSGRAYNNGSASVSFTAGSIVGKSYTVTSSPGSYTATGSSSPLTVTGLQSSTQYTYTVTATNNYGTSAASSASSGVTATTVPQAPSVVAAAETETTATITITPGATGGSSITQYSIVSNPATTTQTTVSSPYTFTGLTTNTEYTFTATATNANGTSLSSSASNSVTPVFSGDYESISTVNVSSATSTITFSSIPQTYKHLQLRMLGKTSSADNGSGISVQFNSSNFSNGHRVTGFRNGFDSQYLSASSIVCYFPCTASGVDNMFGGAVLDILDYTNTNKTKTTRCLWGYDNNGVAGGSEFLGMHSGHWDSTSAINSIILTAESSRTFSQYSKFALYGIKG